MDVDLEGLKNIFGFTGAKMKKKSCIRCYKKYEPYYPKNNDKMGISIYMCEPCCDAFIKERENIKNEQNK